MRYPYATFDNNGKSSSNSVVQLWILNFIIWKAFKFVFIIRLLLHHNNNALFFSNGGFLKNHSLKENID